MNLTQRAQRPQSLDIIHKRKCSATFPFTLSTLNSFNPFNPFNP